MTVKACGPHFRNHKSNEILDRYQIEDKCIETLFIETQKIHLYIK